MTLESNQIIKCNLLDTWPKSSSVNNINLVKKICYNSGDIDFFSRGLFFIGAPCKGVSKFQNGSRYPSHSPLGINFSLIEKELHVLC